MSFTGQRMEFSGGETTWCGTGITTPRQSQIGPAVNFGDICHILTCSKECSEKGTRTQDFFFFLFSFFFFQNIFLFSLYLVVSFHYSLPKVPFCVTFVYVFFTHLISYSNSTFPPIIAHNFTYSNHYITLNACCHILEKVEPQYQPLSNTHLTIISCLNFNCLGKAYLASALNHSESGYSRPLTFCTASSGSLFFGDTELSPWSLSSPNGATFSCSWASSW